MKNISILITGMHCNHCKMTVEDNVGKLQGIRSVKANISTGIVELSGEDFDLGQVREKIESLGYNYKGEADKLP